MYALIVEELSGQRGNSSRLSPELEIETAKQVLCHLERLLPWPLSQLPHTHTALNSMLRALRTPLLNKQVNENPLSFIIML